MPAHKDPEDSVSGVFARSRILDQVSGSLLGGQGMDKLPPAERAANAVRELRSLEDEHRVASAERKREAPRADA